MAKTNNTEYSEEERIRALLENINAYIEHFHGGSVEMVELKGKKTQSAPGRRVPGLPALADHIAWLGGRHHSSIFPGHRGNCCIISLGVPSRFNQQLCPIA